MAHYLTGVQTRKSSNLNARLFESFIEIHPVTAERYAIAENTLVNIESPRGKITVRSRLSEQIREDTVFVPFHWAENQTLTCSWKGVWIRSVECPDSSGRLSVFLPIKNSTKKPGPKKARLSYAAYIC